ncbi:MAG TPA: hypothetical protein VD884_12925 [Ohtaekwangia sp.]|nr:hypothetical protein [Ohtaekwangia sp.]
MDKNRKKEILREYKRNELEKLSRSDDKVLASLAKNKLGLKSDGLSVKTLVEIEDNKLIETIVEKISEVLEARYQSDPKKYKISDNVVPELNPSLRAIHFTNIFEMYLGMGDTDKFLEGATSFEVHEVINGYRLLKLDGIAYKILLLTIDEIEMEFIDLLKIERIKIDYIRGHLNEFELN